MKKSKKIKLITSLSSLAVTATAVSTIATGCSTLVPEKSVDNLGSNSNGTKIDVTSISWVKKTKYDSNDTGIIKMIVSNDNSTVFAKYRGLEEVMEIDVTYDQSASEPITVKLTNNGKNKRYTGATGTTEDPAISWKAKYSAQPTPVPPEPTQITQVTHSELVGLKNAGLLEPGRQYQITDYTTTVDTGTETNRGNYYGKAISCSKLSSYITTYGDYYNPKFDLIVTATSKTSISDNASVVKNISDKYFPDFTKFSAWTVKYCLENDTEKYDWATTNGKGVIYYLKDEFGNEAPYDFKSILFWREYNQTSLPCFTFNYFHNGYSLADSSIYADNDLTPKNGQSLNAAFGYPASNVRNNVIKTYIESNQQKLNCNVFQGRECNNNELAENCYGNTFNCSGMYASGSSYNKLGIGCSNNDFGYNFQGNTFGNFCCNNYIEQDFQWNTFGNNCCNNQVFNSNSNPQPLQSNNTFDTGVSNITIEPVHFDYNHVHFTIGSSFWQPSNNITFTNGIPEGATEYYTVGPLMFEPNNVNTVVRSPLKLMNMNEEVDPQPENWDRWEFQDVQLVNYDETWAYITDYNDEPTVTLRTTNYGTFRIILWDEPQDNIVCARTFNLDKLPQYTIKGLDTDKKLHNAFYYQSTRSEPLELYYGDQKVESEDVKFKITRWNVGLNVSIDSNTNEVVYDAPSNYGDMDFALEAYIGDTRVFMQDVEVKVWNLQANPIWGKSGNDQGPYAGESVNYISFMQQDGYADELLSLSDGDYITWIQDESSPNVTDVTFPSYGEKAASMTVKVNDKAAIGDKIYIAVRLHLASYGITVDRGFSAPVIEAPYTIDNLTWEKDNGLVIVGRDNISTEGLKLYRGTQQVGDVTFEIDDARTSTGLKRHVSIEKDTNKVILNDPQYPPYVESTSNGAEISAPVIAVKAYWTDPTTKKPMSHMEVLPVVMQYTEYYVVWGDGLLGPEPGSENDYNFVFNYNEIIGGNERITCNAENPNFRWSDNINEVALTDEGKLHVSVKNTEDMDLDAYIKMDVQYYDRTEKEPKPIGDPITLTYNFKIYDKEAYDIVAPNGLDEISTENLKGIQLSVTQRDQAIELKQPEWWVDNISPVKKGLEGDGSGGSSQVFDFEDETSGLLIPNFEPGYTGTFEVTVGVYDSSGSIPYEIMKTFTITVGDTWMENPYSVRENCIIDQATSTINMVSNESDAMFSLADIPGAMKNPATIYRLAEEVDGIKVDTQVITEKTEQGESSIPVANVTISKDMDPGEYPIAIDSVLDGQVLSTRTFNVIVPSTGNTADSGFAQITTSEKDMEVFLNDTKEMATIPYPMTISLNNKVQMYNLTTYLKPINLIRGMLTTIGGLAAKQWKLEEGDVATYNITWFTAQDDIYVEWTPYIEKDGIVTKSISFSFNFHDYYDWTQYGMFEGKGVMWDAENAQQTTMSMDGSLKRFAQTPDGLWRLMYSPITQEEYMNFTILSEDLVNINFVKE